MKSLLSKAMLVALLVSVAPTQSTHADKYGILKTLGCYAIMTTGACGGYLTSYYIGRRLNPNWPKLTQEDELRTETNALTGMLVGLIGSMFALHKLGLTKVK